MFESLKNINRLETSNIDIKDYEAFIPDRLRNPTGNKIKKASFEEINPHLYESDARMAAFRVPREKIVPYIQALHFVFFDSIGKEPQYKVTWNETPSHWEKESTGNAICIDVQYKDSEEKLFRTTFFITTGTVQVQGNSKDIFVNQIFPVLKNVANSIPSDSTNVKEVVTSETTYTKESTTTQPEEPLKTSQITVEKDTNVSVNQIETKDTQSQTICQDVKKADSLEENLLSVTDKIYTQVTNLISNKFSEMCNAQHVYENRLKKEMSEIKEDVMSLKTKFQNQNGDKKNESTDVKYEKLERENRGLGEKIKMLEHKVKQFEDKYKDEKQSHEVTKSTMNHYIEEAKKEEEYLIARMDTKTQEIYELERAVQAYKKIINSKEEELYSMKLHVGSMQDKRAGQFMMVDKTTQSPNKARERDRTTDTDRETKETSDAKEKKPSILLIGTSNLKYINPQRWTQYTTDKETAYTVESAIETVTKYDSNQQPNAIVLHTLTNEIKSQTNAEGCAQKMLALTEITTKKFPQSTLIISLETPRKDSVERNNKVELVNVILKQKFRDNEKIILCENNNFILDGKPISKFVETDGVHLTKEGAAVLGCNLKKAIDKACNYKRQPLYKSKNAPYKGANPYRPSWKRNQHMNPYQNNDWKDFRPYHAYRGRPWH